MAIVWLVAWLVFRDSHLIPDPASVWREVWTFRGTYFASTVETMREAIIGFLLAVIASIGLGVGISFSRYLSSAVEQLGGAVYALPAVIVGPVLSIGFEPTAVATIIAALSAFFPSVVGVVAGMRGADELLMDVARSSGSSRGRTFWAIVLRMAIPHWCDGWRIAFPMAVVAAIVGEFFGADRGLGVLLTDGLANANVARTWAVALIATLAASVGYGCLSMAQARFGAAGESIATSVGTRLQSDGLWRRSTVVHAGFLAAAILILLWYASIPLSGLPAYAVRTPLEVAQFVFTGPPAERLAIVHAWLITLGDSLIGLAAGVVLVLPVVGLFIARPTVRPLVLPVFVGVRAVPLVAFIPLLVLLVGHGFMLIAVVGALLTFFPLLIFTCSSVALVPPAALEIAQASGASWWATIRYVELPAAASGIRAGFRLAIPQAVVGAMLAEWLGTGSGVGYLVVAAQTSSEFDVIWTASATVALTVIVASSLLWGGESRSIGR
jgi:sulfonate transport system permease protein